MIQLVFLLEEPSIKEVLNVVLPQVLPETTNFRLIAHEGKSDLEKSIPRKLRAWQNPAIRFVVVRDCDSADCHVVKRRLQGLCERAGRPGSLVRIVCNELESWFLGDLLAVEKAFQLKGLAGKQQKRKYRDPDRLKNAKQELKKLAPRFQALRGSRAVARRRLQAAIGALPEHEREVFVLRELEGLRYREIAELAEIPQGTVMSRLYSARRRLAHELEDER